MKCVTRQPLEQDREELNRLLPSSRYAVPVEWTQSTGSLPSRDDFRESINDRERSH
jgi:hypothetical protein